MARLSPIPPIVLDPRNESDLVSGAIARTIAASGGTITQIDPATVESALIEGCAFTAAQLLVYLNLSVEAWSVQFLSSIVGVGIRLDSQAVVVVQFTRGAAYVNTSYVVPRGTQISNQNGNKIFNTSEDLTFLIGDTVGTVLAIAVESGSAFNVTTDDSARLISPIAQILSVSFLSDSFAGEDAETYGDVKSRAFDLLHRRSPISLEDWVGFAQDFFGTDAKIVVTRGTTSGKRYYLDTTNTTLSYDGTLTNLLQLMSINGYTPTINDQNRFEAILRENTQTNDSIYISISSATNNDYSINVLSSFIASARLFAQSGQQVYCNNCTKQYIDLFLIFDRNTTFDEISTISLTRNLVNDYFNTLQPGEELNFNILFGIISSVINIKFLSFSTSRISNYGINDSQVEVENFRYFLKTTVTNQGSFTLFEMRGETIFYYVEDAVAPYNIIEFNSDVRLIPLTQDVVWRINNVFPSVEIENPPGKLLRCNNDGSSLRIDENGQQITVTKDYGCLLFS